MLIIPIKTYACTSCGYAQDFEPTQELTDKHFNNAKHFRLEDVKANECPSCRLKGNTGVMAKVTDPAKKSKMRIIENQADIDKRKDELRAKPGEKILMGEEIREETDDEKAERVEKSLEHVPKKAKAKGRAAGLAMPKMTRAFEVHREQTPEEKEEHIEELTAHMKVTPAAKIAQIREKYEDK